MGGHAAGNPIGPLGCTVNHLAGSVFPGLLPSLDKLPGLRPVQGAKRIGARNPSF